jgi:hypothetical protein
MSLQTMNGPTGADLEGIQPGDKGGAQYIPGKAIFIIALVLFVPHAWFSLFPTWPLISIPVLLGWFVLTCVLIVNTFMRNSGLRRIDATMAGEERIRWSLAWGICLLALLLRLGLGYVIGFQLSRPAMNRLVERARLAPPKEYWGIHEWAGIYRVQSVSCNVNPMAGYAGDLHCSVTLRDADDGHGGFVYMHRTSDHRHESPGASLGGGWYAWHSQFPT